MIEVYGENPSLTREEADALGVDVIKPDTLVTKGPWNIAKSYEAQCVAVKTNTAKYGAVITEMTLFVGKRKLQSVKTEGTHLEGAISYKGRVYSAYTTMMLIDVDGELIDLPVIKIRNFIWE